MLLEICASYLKIFGPTTLECLWTGRLSFTNLIHTIKRVRQDQWLGRNQRKSWTFIARQSERNREMEDVQLHSWLAFHTTLVWFCANYKTIHRTIVPSNIPRLLKKHSKRPELSYFRFMPYLLISIRLINFFCVLSSALREEALSEVITQETYEQF